MVEPCKLIIPTSIRGNLGISSKGRSKASHPNENILLIFTTAFRMITGRCKKGLLTSSITFTFISAILNSLIKQRA